MFPTEEYKTGGGLKCPTFQSHSPIYPTFAKKEVKHTLRLPPVQQPDGTVARSTKRLSSRFYQIKMGHCLSGQYLSWTKNRPTPPCWWCRYPNQTRENLFKVSPEWKAQQKILWEEVWKETRRWKDRWKIRDLLVDERCGRAVLDFLASTDVGRRVLAEEANTVGEVSGAEVREWEEEQGAGAEEPDAGGGMTTVPAHARLHGDRRTGGVGGGLCDSFVSFFCPPHPFGSFPLQFPWFAIHFLFGTGLGREQRGACKVPPPRGQRAGTGS